MVHVRLILDRAVGVFSLVQKNREAPLGREPGTTNNRMEITSAIRSVEDLNRLQVLR
jgi:ribonuclease HI